MQSSSHLIYEDINSQVIKGIYFYRGLVQPFPIISRFSICISAYHYFCVYLCLPISIFTPFLSLLNHNSFDRFIFVAVDKNHYCHILLTQLSLPPPWMVICEGPLSCRFWGLMVTKCQLPSYTSLSWFSCVYAFLCVCVCTRAFVSVRALQGKQWITDNS